MKPLSAIRLFVLRNSLPLTRLLGGINIPVKDREFTDDDMVELQPLIKQGDVLITFRKWELSNLFIPGDWSHTAIYVGKGRVIEAVGEGVISRGLAGFCQSKDRVMVVRPRFPRTFDTTMSALKFCREQLGKPYDPIFEDSDKAFYCSELIYDAYRLTHDGFNMKIRDVWGVKTVLPDDFLPGDSWEMVFISKRYA